MEDWDTKNNLHSELLPPFNFATHEMENPFTTPRFWKKKLRKTRIVLFFCSGGGNVGEGGRRGGGSVSIESRGRGECTGVKMDAFVLLAFFPPVFPYFSRL